MLWILVACVHTDQPSIRLLADRTTKIVQCRRGLAVVVPSIQDGAERQRVNGSRREHVLPASHRLLRKQPVRRLGSTVASYTVYCSRSIENNQLFPCVNPYKQLIDTLPLYNIHVHPRSTMALLAYRSGYRPISSTRMFEPRHNIVPNVRTNVRNML